MKMPSQKSIAHRKGEDSDTYPGKNYILERGRLRNTLNLPLNLLKPLLIVTFLG
jgi:hypothetical protein